MSARENNPIYIMEQVIENNFPSIARGWANYVTNEIINALNSKGFDIAKVETTEEKVCQLLTSGGDCFLAELNGFKRVECIKTKGKICKDERFVDIN